MQKVIGGEIEIDLAKIGTKYSLNNSHVFSSGRAALYHILKLLSTCNKFKKVLRIDQTIKQCEIMKACEHAFLFIFKHCLLVDNKEVTE